jgi:hypothetical protein
MRARHRFILADPLSTPPAPPRWSVQSPGPEPGLFHPLTPGAQRNQIGSERALASVSSRWSEAIGRVAQGRRRGSLASLFP